MAAAASVGGFLVPAQAAGEGWTLVSSGVAEKSVDLDVHLAVPVRPKSESAPCLPTQTGMETHSLSWEVWYNPQYGAVAYDWSNGGMAWSSTKCSTAARVTISLTDYAPNGKPPVVFGAPLMITQTRAANGRYTATSLPNAGLWVEYYNFPNLYMRGEALVETKVKGEYRNHDGKWVTIGCTVTYNTVHPTPTGPQVDRPTAPQPCR
ncbi:MAG TPA: hypothetical protein VNQ77_06280 [Frankiaceae bacterium]|nr:hypothetical protein [Frankiaceae bacterium]